MEKGQLSQKKEVGKDEENENSPWEQHGSHCFDQGLLSVC